MPTPTGNKVNVTICWILGGALALRVAVAGLAFGLAGDKQVFHSPDSASYINLAAELVHHGSFGQNETPEIVRTPGYPLFLAVPVLSPHVELVTVALQIVLSCLTVYLVFRTALLVVGTSTSAIIAAILMALEPLSVIYTCKILSETLFTTLTMLWLYYLVSWFRTTRLRQLIIAAVALAASAYVRPVSYFLPLLITILLLIWTAARHRRLFGHVAVFFLVAAAPLALWQLRNYRHGQYVGFAAVTDVNLYFYQAASLEARRKNISYYQMQKRMGYRDPNLYFANHPEQRSWRHGARYMYMRREALKTLAAEPGAYLGVHLRGMLRTLLDPGAAELLKLFQLYPDSGGLLGTVIDKGVRAAMARALREQPLMFCSTILLGLLLALYLLAAGAALLSKRFLRNISVHLLWAVGAYLLILSGGPYALDRFRHPIMPIVCIFAGFSLHRLWTRRRRPSKSPDKTTFIKKKCKIAELNRASPGTLYRWRLAGFVVHVTTNAAETAAIHTKYKFLYAELNRASPGDLSFRGTCHSGLDPESRLYS